MAKRVSLVLNSNILQRKKSRKHGDALNSQQFSLAGTNDHASYHIVSYTQ